MATAKTILLLWLGVCQALRFEGPDWEEDEAAEGTEPNWEEEEAAGGPVPQDDGTILDEGFISQSIEEAERSGADEIARLGLHEWQMRKARALFSTKCNMTVDTMNKVIHLETAEGPMQVTTKGVIKDGKNIGNAPASPYICTAKDTNPTPGSVAIFTQATTSSYIMNGKEGQWDGFRNQHCYAKAHRKGHILWFGAVGAEQRAFLNHKSNDAVPCKDGSPSNHYFRALALKAILDEQPDAGWLLQMDLDAFFPATHFTEDMEEKFLTNSGADIVAGKPSYRVLVNAAILAFKNNEFGKKFLGNWFKNRCGFKDQISLWNSLFLAFKEEDPKFTWDQKKMSKYSSATSEAVHAVAKHFGFPKGQVRLPHLVINGGGFRFGHNPYMCHAKKGKTPCAGCSGSHYCSGAAKCQCN